MKIQDRLEKNEKKHQKSVNKARVKELGVSSIFDIKDSEQLEGMSLDEVKDILNYSEVIYPENISTKEAMMGYLNKYVLK
jgi:ribosomal protein L7/L12